MSDHAAPVLPPVSPAPPAHGQDRARPARRRHDRRDRAARAGPLLPDPARAWARWSTDFFTTDPTGNFLGDPGGDQERDPRHDRDRRARDRDRGADRASASRSTWSSTARTSRFAHVVRYFVDVMTGVPSIVFGLFIYIMLILAGQRRRGFAGWKGSVALALLMLPIVTRAAEVVLMLVPDSLREARARARRAALARRLPGRAADRAAGPGHGHRCSRSRAPPARRRRCSSPPRS